MSQIEPPPTPVELIEKRPGDLYVTSSIWKLWFRRLHTFVESIYTSLIAHTSITKWNAHGDTATVDGDAANPLKIVNGSLWIDNGTGLTGGTGAYPTGAEWQGVTTENKLLWIGEKGAFRAGAVLNDGWDSANIGTHSFAVGKGSKASGQDSIAIGGNSLCTGFQSAITGVGSTASGIFNLVFGHNCEVTSGFVGGAFGNYCVASANSAFTMGSGAGAGANRLINNISDSMMIGVGSASPTLLLKGGKCRIGDSTLPLSTLDVGGSVGFKYDLLLASNGGSDTLSDEYVVFVDMRNVTAGNNYTVNLPPLGASTIDRRIYYIKIISTNGTWAGTSNLIIDPDASDSIENIDGAPSSAGTLKAAGVPLTLSMGGTAGNRGATLTLIADNNNGGWWLI